MKTMLLRSILPLLLSLLLVGAAQSVDLEKLQNCLDNGESIQLACDNIDSTPESEIASEKIYHDDYYVRARLVCKGDIDVAAVACFVEEEDGGYGVGVVSQNADATITPMCFNSFNFNGEVRKYIAICLGAQVDEEETADDGGGGGRKLPSTRSSGSRSRTRSSGSRSRRASGTTTGSAGSSTGSGLGKGKGYADLVCNEPPKPSLWEIRQVLEFVEIE